MEQHQWFPFSFFYVFEFSVLLYFVTHSDGVVKYILWRNQSFAKVSIWVKLRQIK